MLHDEEVSSVTFWVVLGYSIPSIFCASSHAIWGLHSADEVVHFPWIYWLLCFVVSWAFFSPRNTRTVRKCRKASKLAQDFGVILLSGESCLAQGKGYLLKHIRFTIP